MILHSECARKDPRRGVPGKERGYREAKMRGEWVGKKMREGKEGMGREKERQKGSEKTYLQF